MSDATAVEHPGPSGPRVGLQLVSECPVCGGEEAEPVAVGNDFAHGTTGDSFLAVRCRECELVYLNPHPAEGEHLRLHPPSYFSPSECGARTGLRSMRALVRQAVRYCGALPRNARLLEVGYGAALHLDGVRRAGPRTWVLEAVTPHESLARSARQGGEIVYQGRADALQDLRAAFDAVLLLHGLEHCASPVHELLSLRRLLRAGGRLVILTHNADSAVRRLFEGRHWAGYDFPRHASLFGPRTLRRLAATTGYEVERLSTARNSQMWVRSAAHLFKDWNASPWLIHRSRPGALLLGGLASLAEGAAHLAGRGARLEAVLRKPEETDG